MVYECIVFSDPRSTTRIQIATRDGSQSTYGAWTGKMIFEKLKVFSAQNRNSTCTFNITSFNTADNTTTWMLPGIGVFVVHLGMLRFSGVITKVDGSYMGSDGKQIYVVTCESDANYLMNYSPISKTIHKVDSITNVIKDIVDPYFLWYNEVSSAGFFWGSAKVDYTVSNKPILTQIQEVSHITGYVYNTRTLSTLGTIGITGYNVVMNSTYPDPFISPTKGLAWGSHNKYILVLIDDSIASYHNCAAAVTATNPTLNSVTITPTNAINISSIITGRRCLLIQHPVLEFSERLLPRTMYNDPAYSITKRFFINPTSNTYNTLCWDYNPLSEKNDVITKVMSSGVDVNGNPVSVRMAAAYRYDSSDKTFMLEGGTKPYVDISYESTILYSNLVNTGGVYKGAIQVFADTGISWSAGGYCYLCQTTGGGAEERALVDSVAHSGDVVNGRPTIWLQFTAAGLSYLYSIGDVITWAELNYMYSKIHVSTTTGFVANVNYWIGSELVRVMNINPPSNIYCARGRNFVSPSKGYSLTTRAIPHKVGCPIMDGNRFDIDDYYPASPMATYGTNVKNITTNKTVDAGTLELLTYNVLRNKCVPRYKGNMSCMITALSGYLYNDVKIPMRPGDLFLIDFFGTLQPSASIYYETMSIDFDFDTGTATVQFGEYDIQLIQWLQQSGLNVMIS